MHCNWVHCPLGAHHAGGLLHTTKFIQFKKDQNQGNLGGRQLHRMLDTVRWAQLPSGDWASEGFFSFTPNHCWPNGTRTKGTN